MHALPSAPGARRQAGLRLALLWQRCDLLSGALLCAMVVFSPWAFGGTPVWAIWTMNVAGYTLGVLLLLKLFIRGFWNYRPPRWDDPPTRSTQRLIVMLAVLTVAILAYCAVAALNASSTYSRATATFAYRSHITWLPHSYDGGRTWHYFFNYLAMALAFWSARDWLLGKTSVEPRVNRPHETDFCSGVRVPGRLRLLLWVLSVSGALLATVALIQRLSGTDKLLWVLLPRLNASADVQLGPFNYRSNGAQYLNLVWPVALGLWWRLRRAARHLPEKTPWRRRYQHHLLLPCVLMMAATPILSLSRGGAIVCVVCMLASAGILWFGWRHHSMVPRLGLLLFFGLAFGLGLYVSGEKLGERLEQADEGFLQRERIFETARKIARDYPFFGTGPGTMDPVFQLYRASPSDYWPARLHNDWLETRVTFGWLGSALIALAFLAVLARYFLPGGMPTGWRLTLLIWVALGGCLLHARWDFPLQVYSILFLFLLYCAMLTTFSRRVLT